VGEKIPTQLGPLETANLNQNPLVGSHMTERSKLIIQTKTDNLVLQVGGWAWGRKPQIYNDDSDIILNVLTMYRIRYIDSCNNVIHILM
jgi:hypothetical protein